jgi:3-hydroxyacyl-CoA dehydrogenase/enoyl-CoA hydratase/3-hydroxybutyryl-CoA epimerase
VTTTEPVRLERRPGGVAVLILDTPGSPVNVLSAELLQRMGPLLDAVEQDAELRAAVIASGKPGTFIAGADLKQLVAIESGDEAARISRDAQALLGRIAASRKPFVAAIHGAALGGGLEVALACRYRLAADDPKTVLALPEVQLGVLPGAAGTQRLPRLIGLTRALPLMLTGKRVRARQAYRLGLVDALTSPGGIVETAAAAARGLADGTLSPRRRRRKLAERLLESAPGRRIVFRQARSGVRAKTRGLYPAPPAIIECVETGLARGIEAGLERESKRFGELVAGAEAKQLIGLFEGMTSLKKPFDGPSPREVRRLAVLGGGFMGSGIASVSLPLAPVTVKDLDESVLQRCAREVHEGLKRRVRSGAITRFQLDQQQARLHLGTSDEDLVGADLVIEAVFEDLQLKRRVLADVEERIAPDAVFASNTSALPIREIAAEARHPERVLGMHYFSPVPKMPLLELVVAERTDPQAVATAHRFGVRQGKTVIVVRDGPGFYTSRILSPYLNEAALLLEEGARTEDVDRALLDFGYPVGPLALLDEVGIDVAAHVAENFGALFAERGLGGTSAFPRLRAKEYLGRKNRRGFYRYETGKKKGKGRRPANEDVYALLGGKPRRDFAADELAERLALLMVNEAVYCLQEQVIAEPRDGDVGAILGLGFPPFRGGPFRYVDARGVSDVVGVMERLRDAHGPRFEPAPLLREMARDGRRFYGPREG